MGEKKKKSVLFLEDEKKKCTECRKKLLQASDLTSEEFRYLCLKTQEEIWSKEEWDYCNLMVTWRLAPAHLFWSQCRAGSFIKAVTAPGIPGKGWSWGAGLSWKGLLGQAQGTQLCLLQLLLCLLCLFLALHELIRAGSQPQALQEPSSQPGLLWEGGNLGGREPWRNIPCLPPGIPASAAPLTKKIGPGLF